MPDCMTPGQLNTDGPCTLFTQVNDNGLNLYTCSEFVYTPAVCPDDPAEGTINAGVAAAKIASVDGTVPDVCVQRDSNGIGAVTGLDLDVNPCDHMGTRIRELIVSIGNGDGANDPGAGAVASTLLLRGHGDLIGGGGTETSATVGFTMIQRLGTRDGVTKYINVGTGNAEGHKFSILDITGPVVQELMWLEPAAGTLYFPAWTYVSDVRLKENVEALIGEKALQVILGITPIAYEMHGQKYHGFSAQNVQAVLPDAVKESPTRSSPMTMRDGDILANLVAAVKVLAAEVEALKAKAGA